MKHIIILSITLLILIPINYSYALPKETTLTLESIHKIYRVGEDIIFTGKLVDSQNYMLTNEQIKITPSNVLTKSIGTGLTDARGNFRIVVPAQLWNGDGKNVSFVAHYDGSDKFQATKSNTIISEMRKLYTPLGEENNYEKLQEEGYFNQKTAPDKSISSSPIPINADNVLIDRHGSKRGEFSVQNVRVTEKEFYKVITIDVHIKVINLELENMVLVSPMNTILVNQNGKTYTQQFDECKIPIIYEMRGKTGPNGAFSTCFSVEKEFNNFKVYYKTDQSYLIGEIDLTKNNQPVKNSNNDELDIPKKSTDFFSQLIDMFRSWFNFS